MTLTRRSIQGKSDHFKSESILMHGRVTMFGELKMERPRYWAHPHGNFDRAKILPGQKLERVKVLHAFM